jgi:flagellin
MVINHNIAALNTYNQLSKNEKAQSSSLAKLSSGLKINSAADDAAGLAISQKMTAQVKGLDQATSNAQNGISLVQTADGALGETQSILQRMRELSVQSATDTNTDSDRSKIQAETDQLAQEITRISNTTEFNTKNLLAGGFTNNKFQIGANKDQNISVSVSAMDAQSLGVAAGSINTTYTTTDSKISTLSTTSPNLNSTFVDSKYTAAAYGTISHTNGVTTAAAGGTYTGSADATFQVRVNTASAGTVTDASYTTDGGTTWSSASMSGTTATLSNGATLDMTNAGNTTGNTYTFTATAETMTFGLSTADDHGGTVIGTDVVVHNNQSAATIGDSASNRVANITFNFATASTVGAAFKGDAITQTLANSTAATIGANGSITTGAVVQKGIDVSSQGAANSAITTIDNAINTVSVQRAALGAVQNRLDHTINNLTTQSQNMSAASSQITDVDMAKEMMSYTKSNILNQAAQAMLAQANQLPQGALQLLK